ncbi:hypothetical protein SAMN02745148_02932 [Modicisalibacter ilicicola DSM 19980]|uniref:Quinol:cytochrome c oxidoreductase quinone-binding subunit 2 n=1 Tax=Modicisalibacter ilicicola DSM 19980 TaxID=1121942 RepID=A0A1M5CIF4_9GAMM|nr:hypothetical protein [Halomonas ilicicola]SHF54534.1 hypothetical protein SAMN02745148_02932 [Halomonas ilicicola DSM 19980]
MSRSVLILVLGLALGLCLIGGFFDPQGLAQAWLAAWLTLGFLSLGTMALLMVHGLTGGAWGNESKHLWKALAAATPLLALALLPLLLFLGGLFPWMAPAETLPEVVRHKQFYLNAPFFIGRTLFYLTAWCLLAWWLVRPSPARRWHAPGLILWALTVTFFSYDWIMSLEPRFYSDIFGIERMVFGVGGAMALGLALGAKPLRSGVRLDLANLWLATLLGWAFVNFAQLIIIWSGNMPDEILWYLQRGAGAWGWVGRASVLLFLVIPFAMLLPTQAKRRAGWLRAAALITLTGYLLHSQWLIWPSLPATAWAWLLTPAAVVALVAFCLLGLGASHRQALFAPARQASQGADEATLSVRQEVRHENP